MKMIINSQTLLTALQTVSKAIAKNYHVPIIENFLFDVCNGVLSVSATDMQLTFKLSWKVECSPDTCFQCVVPKDVSKYLAKLDGPITFSYTAESYSIELLDDESRAKYSGDNPADFPKAPQTNDDLFCADSDLFAEFGDLLNYVSTDKTRPAMNGIGLFARNGLEMCATNAHIVKVVTVPGIQATARKVADWQDDQLFILPAKAANILADLKFGTAKKPVTEGVNVKGKYDKHETRKDHLVTVSFLFSYGAFNAELITVTTDALYPAYWNVIPVNPVTKYTTDKKKFLNVVDKAQLFTNKRTKEIKLSLNGCNKIIAEDLDFSNEYSAEVGGQCEGEAMEIGFNAGFINTVVSSFGDSITLELKAPNKAAVIREGNRLALCMPIVKY